MRLRLQARLQLPLREVLVLQLIQCPRAVSVQTIVEVIRAVRAGRRAASTP